MWFVCLRFGVYGWVVVGGFDFGLGVLCLLISDLCFSVACCCHFVGLLQRRFVGLVFCLFCIVLDFGFAIYGSLY